MRSWNESTNPQRGGKGDGRRLREKVSGKVFGRLPSAACGGRFPAFNVVWNEVRGVLTDALQGLSAAQEEAGRPKLRPDNEI